jgi:nucleotide-binding universal stress UspA family protein
MKRVLVLMTGILFSFIGNAQNVFEVVVSDTVVSSQDIYIFRIVVNGNLALPAPDTADIRKPDYYMRRQEAVRKKQNEILEQAEKALTAKGITVAPQALSEYLTLNQVGGYPSIQVVLSTPKQISDYLEWAQDKKSISLALVSAKNSREDLEYDRLFHKLMTKAKERARNIAKQYNKAIGEVVGINETRMPSYYPPGNVYMPGVFDNKIYNVGYSLNGTLTVKFAMR